MKESEVWEKATQAQCLTCGAMHEDLPLHLHGESDLDDVYEFVDCCDDPYLEAQIASSEPLFDNESVDGDYHLPATPPTAFVPEGRTEDSWEYSLNDDFFDLLRAEGILDE